LSGTELGWVLAILPLVGIAAQPFWGQVADRTGARSHIVAFLSMGTALGYVALAAAEGFWAIVFATAAMAVFGTAVLPITISVSLAILRTAGPHAFGFVRVWGTVGYFVLIVSFPWLLDRYQKAQGVVPNDVGVSEPGLGIMFIVTAALALIAALIGFFLPREGVVSVRAARGDWRLLLGNTAYLRFLIFSFAAYLLSQGPMWLFPIFVRSRGGDIDTIRSMWVYMLLVEIPLVLASGIGLQHLGARGLLGVGVFAGGLRWLLCAFVTDLELLGLVQTLHGVTVVGLLMGGPLYLDVVVPEKLRSTAQAVLSMVGVGIAGIASNLGSGWLLDAAGINALYAATGIGSALLGCLVGWMLPLPQRLEEQSACF
ncbi:MAG TPA: MFS transporter, partial [Candidatus Binatia bacterium]|nr:MFS transporter [Candidatus Binatia bacterium]